MPQKAANKKNCAKATEASRHFAEANLQKLSTGYPNAWIHDDGTI